MKKIIFLYFLIFSFLSSQDFFKERNFIIKSYPEAIAVDRMENLYIVDRRTNAILKYNKAGNFLFSFGVRFKDTKEMAIPSDIFIFKDEVYVLYMNNGIYIFDTEGIPVRKFEMNKGSLLGEINGAKSIFVNEDFIYITDSQNNRVQIFKHNGTVYSEFGFKGRGANSFYNPSGISVTKDRIYVSDTGNHTVKIFDKWGIYLDELGIRTINTDNPGSFKEPEDIFVNGKFIYVVDSGNERIQILSNKKEIYGMFGKKGNKNTEFNSIRDVYLDDNYIYVADSSNKCVKIFNYNLDFVTKINPGDSINELLKLVFFIILIFVILIFYFKKS